MKSIVLKFALVLLLFTSCDQPQEYLKSERITVFAMEEKDQEFVPGNMRYSEQSFYKKNGDIEKIEYYNPDGQINGVEKFEYEGNSVKGSSFYDANDILLSTYVFELNENGDIEKRYAYGARSNDLLRIEYYQYNDKGFKIVKEIRTEDDVMDRYFQFSYDAFGNEKNMILRDNTQKVLVSEEYKITKYDDQKKWLEMTGFVDDVPTSYKKRILQYASK